MSKVAIIGLGYVGLSLTKACLSSNHKVVGIDVDKDKVELINKEFSNHQFKGSTSYDLIADCEIVVICVPTPLDANHNPDTKFLKCALLSMAPHVNSSMLVVNESTSYPGTLRNLIAPKLQIDCNFASAPERVDPSNSTWSIKNTPRVVSGIDEVSTYRVRDFYESVCTDVHVVSTPEVAEAAKLLENTFRQVNIALVNEFAQIVQMFGISANETIQAAATKPFGFMPFNPSIGVGGHCIPVDPSYLSFAVKELGGSAEFIDLANKVNLEMHKYVAKRIEKDLGGLNNKIIQIAGISYKPGVSDLRESPALLLISELRNLGAEVIWHDPLVKDWSGEKSVELSGQIELGLIVTPHAEIDFGPWKNGVKVLDLSATSQNFGWAKYL